MKNARRRASSIRVLKGEIVRFPSRFPLDIATDPGFLVRGKGLALQARFQGLAQVLARDGLGILGPAVVQLTPINEFSLGVEKIELRGAGRAVSLGSLLAGVMGDGKIEFQDPGPFLQTGRRVIGIFVGVVGTDADDPHSLGPIFGPDPRQLALDMLHVRAMPAEEDHQEQFIRGKIGEGQGLSGDHVRHPEFGGLGPQVQHGRAYRHNILLIIFYVSRNPDRPGTRLPFGRSLPPGGRPGRNSRPPPWRTLSYGPYVFSFWLFSWRL